MAARGGRGDRAADGGGSVAPPRMGVDGRGGAGCGRCWRGRDCRCRPLRSGAHVPWITCAWTRRSRAGRVRLVLLEAFGRAVLERQTYPDAALAATLGDWFDAARAGRDGRAASRAFRSTTGPRSGTRGRRHPEPPPQYRSEFQRDRDRIIHSSAFRRLAYKTQVFVNHEGDLYRTRVTHSIEVAQIARTIARALALNETLTEGDLAGARSGPYTVRSRRAGRAQRVHARLRWLRAQPAVPAHRR